MHMANQRNRLESQAICKCKKSQGVLDQSMFRLYSLTTLTHYR